MMEIGKDGGEFGVDYNYIFASEPMAQFESSDLFGTDWTDMSRDSIESLWGEYADFRYTYLLLFNSEESYPDGAFGGPNHVPVTIEEL